MPALRTRDTTALEVSTTQDALHPPALAIISPTPRAFAFPIAHALADSPCSSPSHSPFEPDLRALVLSTTPPPPGSPPGSAPASPHRRRKSGSADAGERRPKKGDDDYIKRPENAFILFRRKCCEDRTAALDPLAASADGPAKKQRQADLSKTISQLWKGLAADERQYWEDLARARKKEHEEKYPHYVYRPQRARDKDGRPKARRPRRKGTDDADDADALAFVVPVHRQHARSASAPTPPPYQSIHVPAVYHMPPSCPTSPSLLPMISRRASHDVLPFDYRPESSEFLQGMFSMAGLPTHRDTLHPLDIPAPATHISPASSVSSGPSSPATAHDYAPFPLPLPLDLDLDLGLQMEMQLQHEFAQFNWDPAASPAATSAGTEWDTHPEQLFAANDFDITAIPQLELDVSKCAMAYPTQQEYISPSPVSSTSASPDPADFGIIPFDHLF